MSLCGQPLGICDIWNSGPSRHHTKTTVALLVLLVGRTGVLPDGAWQRTGRGSGRGAAADGADLDGLGGEPIRTGQNRGVELFTDWHDWAVAEPEVRSTLAAGTADAVADAVRFAIWRHGDQRRPTGAPYLEHLLEALEILIRGADVRDPDVLCAAVLHDVVEDTPCTIAEITENFGPRVAELVGWVTIPEAGAGQDKKKLKDQYLRRLKDAPEGARLVKLADRASNVQTLRNLKPGKQREYYAQTVQHIMPLASDFPWFARWYADWRSNHADLG
jgi:hypothetical protein